MLRRDVEVERVLLCTKAVDMRRGIDGLVSYVRLNYGMDPLEKGTLFLFCGRNRSRIKALIYEGTGWTLLYHRLSMGRFCWPSKTDEARQLTWEEYDRLMAGFAVDSSMANSDKNF